MNELLQWSIGYRDVRSSMRLIEPTTPAYEHPNGFMKIPLAVDPWGTRLFLHLWSVRCGDRDIHDHRWDFASRVLIGRLTNTTYELRREDALTDGGFLVCRYTPTAKGLHYSIDPRGWPCTVVSQSACTLEEGQRYGLSVDVFHTATADEGTVTLMSRGPARADWARILIRMRGGRPDKPTSDRLDNIPEERRRDLCRAVLERLETSCDPGFTST